MALKIIKNRPKLVSGGNTGIPELDQQNIPLGVDRNLWNAYKGNNNYGMIDPSSVVGSDLLGSSNNNSYTNPLMNNYLPGLDLGEVNSQNLNSIYAQNGILPIPQQIQNVAGTPKVVETQDQEKENKTKRSQDGNPMDPMQFPYYNADIPSRMQMLGRSIGRMGQYGEGSGAASAANIAQGAFAATALGLGMTREIMSAASSERARMTDLAGNKERYMKAQKESMIKYGQEGGGVNLGSGDRFSTEDLTGEYIYPLPKSMEDNANVEIEKGEYALTPDIVGPMEAKGERHEKGGTKVDLPVAHIISDYRTITEDLASHVRDNYGVRATSKDTYATLVDRYKKKIGLSQKYEDQEKILKKLDKNDDVKDKNTSELNKSVLSKYISENQEEINDMEERLRSFADVIYEAQERSKKNEKIDKFFREGGPIKPEDVSKGAKRYGLTESQAREMIYDEYVKQVRKMAVGGPTEEDIARNKKLANIFNQQFGRQLRMSVYDVEGVDKFLNPGSSIKDNQSYQNKQQNVYGNVPVETAYTNLLDINRWAKDMRKGSDFDTESFQTEYNRRLNNIWALAESGIISNADMAKKFRDQYGFWGEDAGDYSAGDKSAYNSFSVDDKFGKTTASRSYVGFDVLTPEQKRLLRDKDIKNYVDLFDESKSEDAKKILGDDYKKFEAIKNSGFANDFDFILDAVNPAQEIDPGKKVAPTEEISPLINKVQSPGRITIPVTPEEKANAAEEQGSPTPRATSSSSWNAMFPEILRPAPSGIITEGMERYLSPRIDPVLQSADQYISELNRTTQSQLDSLQDIPDSQRAAIMTNINAVAGNNIAKYIHQVNLSNAQQINEADRFNESAFAQTAMQNAAERKAYQASTLKAMGIADENAARYLDSINDEVQKKFSVQTSLNTISSITPNMRMLPNGKIVFTSAGQDVISRGDYSTPTLQKMNEEDSKKTKKGGK